MIIEQFLLQRTKTTTDSNSLHLKTLQLEVSGFNLMNHFCTPSSANVARCPAAPLKGYQGTLVENYCPNQIFPYSTSKLETQEDTIIQQFWFIRVNTAWIEVLATRPSNRTSFFTSKPCVCCLKFTVLCFYKVALMAGKKTYSPNKWYFS